MTTLPGLTKDPSPPPTDTQLSPLSIPNGTTLITTKVLNKIIDYLSGDAGPDFIPQAAIDSLVSDLSARELLANKGVSSGYAGLDVLQKLLLANFPSGNALEVLRRNAANTALEFAVESSLTFAVKIKTVDETISNDAVFHDDAELVIPVNANKRYVIKGEFYFQSPPTADLRFFMTLPSGATSERLSGIFTSLTPIFVQDQTTSTVYFTDGNLLATKFNMTVLTAGTAGDLTLQWRQNVADPGNTTVFAGSNLVVYEA